MGNEIATIHNQQKLEHWIRNIQECKASGLSPAEWCETNGYKLKTYYRWHSIIRKRYEEQTRAPEFYEVPNIDVSTEAALAKVVFGQYQVEVYSTAVIPEVAQLCKELQR